MSTASDQLLHLARKDPLPRLPEKHSNIAATFWPQATAGVTYYRCTIPARHLPGKVNPLFFVDIVEEADGTIRFPRQEGAAIWSFAGNRSRAVIMSEMQEQGIPVLMEADDNYLTHPPFNIGQWERKIGKPGAHSYEGFKKILRFCDGAIVSTPFLADLYSRYNQNIHVCPNSVDVDDWPENPPHQEDGVLRVGWAASDSHRYDAPLIERALDWASRQDGVEVVVFGIKPQITGYRFPYRYIPWTDSLSEFRQKLSVIDLMLCPLRPGFWTDAKSDIKAVEAAMSGAAAVVSKAEPYRPWFDRTFVCSTEKEFLKAVKHLVRNRDEVRQLAEDARAYVLAEREIRKTIHTWRDSIASCR